MKPLQGQNSDLLAMLSGKASGAKNAGQAAGEGADLLAMLSGSPKTADLSKNEFAEILSQKGMLEDISAEDLLSFFKKSQDVQGSKGEEVSGLLQHYSQITGKNIDIESLPEDIKALSFDGKEFKSPNGEVIPKNKVLKLLSKVQPQEVKDVEYFSRELKNTKAPKNLKIPHNEKIDKKSMLAKSNASDFVDQKLTVAKSNARPQNIQLAKSGPALSQYGQQAKQMNPSLIKSNKKPEIEAISSSKSVKINKVDSKDSLQDLVQGMNEGNSLDTIAVGDLKGSSASNQEFQMNKGQGTQTLDLSNVSATNKTELIQKVSHYIEQSYVSGRGSVDMIVNHEELGQFRVQAQKIGNNGQVNLEINTLTEQGHQFFAENEVELLKTLNKSGIKLNDFKISPQTDFLAMGDSSKSSMNSDSSSSFLGGGDRGEASAFTQGGRQGDNRGEDRRRQLWQEAKTFSEQMYA